MLVITLIVLTAKFVVKTTFDESKDIIIKAENDENDDVENECALFIIDDKYSTYDNEGLLSDNDFSMEQRNVTEMQQTMEHNKQLKTEELSYNFNKGYFFQLVKFLNKYLYIC